jgi:hypothetical protein
VLASIETRPMNLLMPLAPTDAEQAHTPPDNPER